MKLTPKLLLIPLASIFLHGCFYQKSIPVNWGSEFSNSTADIQKTMNAICKHESGHRNLAINVNKSKTNKYIGSHFFNSALEANEFMDKKLDTNRLNYDIGYCQVNSQHLKKLKLKNEDLLNQKTNMKVATDIYEWNLNHCKGNEMCALSMYNTGYSHDESKIGTKYAKKVLAIRDKMYGF